jgi:hypothetical protein
MKPRNALTLQNQLTLPMIPFLIDTCARAIILGGHVEWYRIPDLVTFLVTYAFFCLGVMFTVNPHALPTDQEARDNVELVRQRLLASSIFAVSLAGGISFFRVFAERYPEHNIYSEYGLVLFVLVAMFSLYSIIRVCGTYMSYVNRGA